MIYPQFPTMTPNLIGVDDAVVTFKLVANGAWIEAELVAEKFTDCFSVNFDGDPQNAVDVRFESLLVENPVVKADDFLNVDFGLKLKFRLTETQRTKLNKLLEEHFLGEHLK